jgi:hypothetical protein
MTVKPSENERFASKPLPLAILGHFHHSNGQMIGRRESGFILVSLLALGCWPLKHLVFPHWE